MWEGGKKGVCESGCQSFVIHFNWHFVIVYLSFRVSELYVDNPGEVERLQVRLNISLPRLSCTGKVYPTDINLGILKKKKKKKVIITPQIIDVKESLNCGIGNIEILNVFCCRIICLTDLHAVVCVINALWS